MSDMHRSVHRILRVMMAAHGQHDVPLIDLYTAFGNQYHIFGEDIGVPTIVFTDGSGQQTGYFGPVLQTLPPEDEALKLWDGLSQLATNSSFYVLKRARPEGGPDTGSTARC